MPAGRTFKYRLHRICERFSRLPSSNEIAQLLDRQDLIDLIAYDEIRTKEEAMQFEATLSAMAIKSAKGL